MKQVMLIIEACALVETELVAHADRMEKIVAKNDGEAKHLRDTARGYRLASSNVRGLREYHEGRIERRQTEMATGVNAEGRVTAYVDDEDAPYPS